FVVIGVAAPLARTATTLSIIDASLEGCARRPACANSAPSRVAAVRKKTKARQPARAFLSSGSAARLLVFVLITRPGSGTVFLGGRLYWFRFLRCRSWLWRC